MDFIILVIFSPPKSRIFGKIHTMKSLAFVSIVMTACAISAATVSEVSFETLDGFGGASGEAAVLCQTKKGETYNPVTLVRDVNALKATDRYEDISVDATEGANGVKVVFKVKRKVRFLQPLVVEGCAYFSESRVAKEAGLKDGYLYGEADLAAAAAKVRLAYNKKGYGDAKVMPRVEMLGGNNAKIIFLVDEGEEADIDEVVFEGAEHAFESSVFNRGLNPFYELVNDQFDAVELHDAISDYPWWDPTGWFLDEPVSRDQRAQCCDKVAEVYRNHGFLDVRVTGPDVRRKDGGAQLVFTVEEGPCYRVGNSVIRGLEHYSETDVALKSDLPQRGTIASERALNDAAQRIRVVIGSGDSGIADTRVEIKRIPTVDDPTMIDLIFQVQEGVPVVINDIKILGNDYTQDKVIRREIALGPNDRMLEDRADRSKRKLENLDYFSRVSYSLEPTGRGKNANGEDYRDLVYEVAEKDTGSFMIGIGASSVDSVYVSAEVNQNNFDLFAPSKLFRGGGQKGRAYIAWGPRYQSAELGFSEPYFLNRMLELSVDAYRRLRWYDQFDLIRSGAQASLSYPVKFWNPERLWKADADETVVFGKFGIGFSGEYIEMDEVENGVFRTEDGEVVSFRDEEHEYSDAFEPVFHLFWVRDGRDNYRMPTSGSRTRIFGDLGPGNKSEYWRLGFSHRSYFKVLPRYNHVLMLALRAETIDAFKKDVPIYNRMFLGGPKSIRGLEYRNVAPMVSKGWNNWDPWGGQSLFCANFEYTIPIIRLFRLAFFTDLGSVGRNEFDLDLNDTFAWTAGVGLRFDIPMFPIRLDFGFPIEKPEHAEEEVFSFTIGYDF